jgi:hypothetical protein
MGSLVRRAGKGLPVGRLLLIGEIALQAGRHVARLEPHERRRLAALLALGARRRGALDAGERAELARLVMKLEPRAFLGAAVRRVSPVPIPRRILEGKRR